MFLNKIKSVIRRYQMKSIFSETTFYRNAIADNLCILGNHTVLFQNTTIVNSSIGRYTYVQAHSHIYNVDIGPFCSIASGVTIGLAMHPTDMLSTSPVFYDNTQPLPHFFTNKKLFSKNLPRTSISADVWIGQEVMIKAGVTIGVGAVIGAGAVVTNDVEPYSIVGGVPAKFIRKRFDEDICDELFKSKWWALDDAKLQKLAPYFLNIEKLLKELKRV